MRRSTLIATRDADAYFGHVRERLRAQEVGRRLGRPRHRHRRDVEVDGHRAAGGETRERALQTLVHQVARVKAEGELAQVGERARELALAPGRDARRSLGLAPARAAASDVLSASSRRTVPSRSRVSSRRRSSSPASTMPPPRGGELGELRAHLGIEPGVRGRQPRRGGDALDEPRVVEDRRVVDERGERPAVALDERHRPRRARARQLDARTVGVDVAAVEPVADLQRRVAERAGERVAQRAGRHVAQLDDEVGDRRPLPRAAEEPGEQSGGDDHEPGLVREQTGLVRVAGGIREARDGRDGEHETDRRRRLQPRQRARRSAPTAPR